MTRVRAVVGFLAAAAAVFTLGFTFRDVEQLRAPDLGALATLVGLGGSKSEDQILNHTYNLIANDYYRPVKQTSLRWAAITGMVASLGDPHTMFLPPQEKEDFEFVTSAQFSGIGCSLDPDPGGVRIAEVFDDSPAQRAGLGPGDLITAVEGKSIAGKARADVVPLIKGEEGTVVRLTVLKAGRKTPIRVALKRARVATPTVLSRYFPDSQVGYISIATFSDPTVEQFDAKMAALRKHPLKGLVIDVRGNPGGLLSAVQDLLGRFVEDKTVVKMRQRDGKEEVATSPSGYKLDLHVPIAVLMNEDSASAAEIFAGCMHDYGVATLVGTHSYGKSSVQHIRPMIDSAGVKVTIARYYLPVTPYFGRVVDADGEYVSGGLKPDVPVKMNEDDDATPGNPKKDAQLAKAIEVVLARR